MLFTLLLLLLIVDMNCWNHSIGRGDFFFIILNSCGHVSNLCIIIFSCMLLYEAAVCSASDFRDAALAYGAVALVFGIVELVTGTCFAVRLKSAWGRAARYLFRRE